MRKRRFASLFSPNQQFATHRLIRDIILGIIGAFVGGWIFTVLGHSGVTGINLCSIFVAAVGAVVVLVFYHAVVGVKI